jgi:hypothetical protein
MIGSDRGRFAQPRPIAVNGQTQRVEETCFAEVEAGERFVSGFSIRCDDQ